ncbi:MAG: ABC transporter transmembrane domain-containing protein [Pseudoclavibacter sp.]
MKPLDPRLLRYARDSRWYLALTGVLGVVHTAAIIAFSWGITMLIVTAFHRHVDWPGLARPAAFSLVAVLVRALAGWAQQTAAQTAAGRVKRSLRAQVVAGLHPRMMRGRSAADIAIVAGRGLDALDAYFSKYLPQLVLTALATPIFVLVILRGDLASGITVICTLPLIPVFMILVGFFTQEVQQAEWTTLRRLSRHFLDVVEGLSTLKVFGRVGPQRRVLAEVAARYRVRTMKVLRVSLRGGLVRGWVVGGGGGPPGGGGGGGGPPPLPRTHHEGAAGVVPVRFRAGDRVDPGRRPGGRLDRHPDDRR